MALWCRYGGAFLALEYFLASGIAIAIATVDAKTYTIPGQLVGVLIFLSLHPAYLRLTGESSWNAFSGALVLGGFFLIVVLLFPGGFGGGDIKFAAALGLLSGFELSLVVLESSLVAGALYGIVYAMATEKGLRIKIPFGPFLTIGLILALLYGREIVLLYQRIVL